MKNDEMKEKFESGEYDVLFKQKKHTDWSKCYRSKDLTWRNDIDYKLIHKKHEHILNALLDIKNTAFYREDGNSIGIESFINTYDENKEYSLTPFGKTKEYYDNINKQIRESKIKKETISIDGYEFYKPDGFDVELLRVLSIGIVAIVKLEDEEDGYVLFDKSSGNIIKSLDDYSYASLIKLTQKKPEWYATEKAQKALRELSAICEDEELYAKLNEFITPF